MFFDKNSKTTLSEKKKIIKLYTKKLVLLTNPYQRIFQLYLQRSICQKNVCILSHISWIHVLHVFVVYKLKHFHSGFVKCSKRLSLESEADAKPLNSIYFLSKLLLFGSL